MPDACPTPEWMNFAGIARVPAHQPTNIPVTRVRIPPLPPNIFMDLNMIKLNLGCGSKILLGYTNIDKFDTYKPDIVHDLEKFPYPFEDNSVNEILLSHVLEHVGQNPDVFNNIIKEFYRICVHGAIINIIVPHPRHDDFISDPTHVRPITVLGG